MLAPCAKLRPRIVPKLPGSATRACASASSQNADEDEDRRQSGERPPPRDKTGPIIPAVVPVSATTLARSIDGADVPMPNVLSARHLSRIGGGLLFAATSKVPWATLLARTFQVDVTSCARCDGRLEVRAVVTDLDIAPKILDAIPTAARAPPALDAKVRIDGVLQTTLPLLADSPSFVRVGIGGHQADGSGASRLHIDDVRCDVTPRLNGAPSTRRPPSRSSRSRRPESGSNRGRRAQDCSRPHKSARKRGLRRPSVDGRRSRRAMSSLA